MASTPEEITKILDEFELNLAAFSTAEGRPAGCTICKDPRVRTINTDILEGRLRQGTIAGKYGFYRVQIIHHQHKCLVRYGKASFSNLERLQSQREKVFPTTGPALAQKRFILNELLFLRDEALRRNPVDRKELLKLAKEIDLAAAEYRKAQEESRKKTREKRLAKGKKGNELELEDAQLSEMQKVL